MEQMFATNTILRGVGGGVPLSKKPMISLARTIASRPEANYPYNHVAVVLKGGSVLSIGVNHHWNHAERDAIGKVSLDKRKNLKLWSLRFNRKGTLCMALPCLKCMKILRTNGVKWLFYSTHEGTIERLKIEAH